MTTATATTPTPAESEYDSANDANFTLDDIYASIDTDLLVSSFGDAAMSYTCSSVDMLVSAATIVDHIPIPRNARAALKDPIYADKWRLAMEAEVKGKFIVNKAWEYVSERIPGRQQGDEGQVDPLGHKYNDNGSVKLFKARWVGCGYSQIEGVDYHDT